jgi:type II secretion system protein N
VKRLSKAILLGGGGLAAAAVVTLLALNLYLRSDSARVQIQEAIADAIDLPVQFESTSLSMLGDLKIHGIRIAQIDGSPGHLLKAQSFTADYRLLPLLGKKLVVPHMTIDSPTLEWRQDAEGDWSWPSQKKRAKDSQPKAKKVKGEKKPRRTPLTGRAKSGFQVEIEDLAMRNGTIDLIDLADEQIQVQMISIRKTKDDADAQRATIEEIRTKIVGGEKFADFVQLHHDDTKQEEAGKDGWFTRSDLDDDLVKIAFTSTAGQVSPVIELKKMYYLLLVGERKNEQGTPILRATGVDIDLSEFAPPDFTGKMRAQKLTWSGLPFDDVATPFTFQDGTLEISALDAQLGGGTARGTFKLETEERGSPFAAQLTLAKVELGKLALTLGLEEGFVSGQVGGDIELHGTMKKFARSEGGGRLQLEGGHFQKLELFETIGQVLGIEELTNLQFNDASAQLRMADERIFIEPLTLATPDLKVTAKGAMRLDSKLDLEARLAVNETIAKCLPSFVRDNFTPSDSDPLKGIDFKVTGTASKPKTDIAEKLIGKKVGTQVSDLLGSLFGSKKNKKDDAEDPSKEPKDSKEKKKKKEKNEKMDEPPPEVPAPTKPEPAKPADPPISRIEPVAPAPAKEPTPQP